MDLAVRKRHKAIALQKVKNALAKEVHNDADVAAIVEAVPQMNAAISVLLVICFERRQNSKLYPGGIAIFLNGSNDLDGDGLAASTVMGLHDFTKCSLAEQTIDLICGAGEQVFGTRSIAAGTYISQ